MTHESIASRILLLRGQRVMLDADLAELYGVPTKALSQAVKRNSRRFPPDFMFQFTTLEKREVVTNSDHHPRRKFERTHPFFFSSIPPGFSPGCSTKPPPPPRD